MIKRKVKKKEGGRKARCATKSKLENTIPGEPAPFSLFFVL